MANPILLHQWPLAAADKVLSASDEQGLTFDAVTAAAANLGALQLAASGTPLSATITDLTLQTGGLALGPSTPTDQYTSTSLLQKPSTAAATAWRGYTHRLFASYFKIIDQASATEDYPHASPARQLADGGVGFVHTQDGVTDSLRFRKKSTRTGAWSSVVVTSTDVDVSYQPDVVVMASGRLLVFARITTYSTTQAFYSDDDGATWASWSLDVQANFDTNAKAISAAVVGDAICIVTGATYDSLGEGRIYWSFDAGQSFILTEQDINMGAARVVATAVGGALLVYASVTTSSVNTQAIIVGGARSSTAAVSTGLGSDPAFLNTVVAVTLADDGSIWAAGSIAYPVNVLECRVSFDHGATWRAPGGSSSSADGWFANHAVSERGYREIHLGEWNGTLVMTAVSSSATAANDNALHEIDFGGWDSMAEGYSASTGSSQLGRTDPYGDGNTTTWTAQDKPEDVSWTKTDVGAGATVTLGDTGLRIVTTAANNSRWDAPAGMWSPAAGDVYRGYFIFIVESGPSAPVTGAAEVFLSISDGANRQFLRFGFGTGSMNIVDNSGQIAVSAVVASQFTVATEVRFVFAHDYPSAGGGIVSAWYRIAGSTTWTTLATNVAVAEQAGNAVEALQIGGSVADASAPVWEIANLFIAQGGGGRVTGFTNPTDLPGRPLGAAYPVKLYEGLRIAAFGGPGIAGDDYTARTTAHYAARNIWLNSRPSCYWKADDNTNQNVVFSMSDRLPFNEVRLYRTTTPTAKAQFANSDVWGGSPFTVALSAVVWEGTATTNEAGVFIVSGDPWVPHQFRSRTGRRWFVEVGAVPGTVFQIDDNLTDTLQIDGLANTFGGAALRIFGDRMAASLPMSQRYSFARILIESQDTAAAIDGYEVGAFFVGIRHEMEVSYDHGFVDRWPTNIKVWRGDAGYATSAIIGPERHELRIAWDLIDRVSTDYMWRLVEFFRACEGEHRVISLWRDPSDPASHGLYRVVGPPARENAWGENANELARLAQLVLIEEP